MSSREQFEAWYLENWGHTEDHHETLFERSPDDESEYYRLGVRMAHQAWQAATNALEAKCAALAADNDTAMAALKQADEVVKSAYEKYVALADENMALKSARQNAMTLPETPATDTFLTEVRAQGVEMLRDSIANIESGTENTIDLHHYCTDFAAQIRQGDAQ